MKSILIGTFMLYLCIPAVINAELFTDPSSNIGQKNLVVGAEYSGVMSEYDLDTKNLPISSERALLKVTTGLTDWFDIYLKAGGSRMILDYKELDAAVTKNFDSKMQAGFGAGARVRLLNYVNSGTQIYWQGGAFFSKNSGSIEKLNITTQTTTDRDIKWLDLYTGIGISKRMDFVELNFGVGFSEVKWWLEDTVRQQTGTITTSGRSKRDSFEIRNPVIGFIGIDFILPLEYRLSAQAGIRDMKNAEFTVAISQGLEK
jgi:hypothetical protein